MGFIFCAKLKKIYKIIFFSQKPGIHEIFKIKILNLKYHHFQDLPILQHQHYNIFKKFVKTYFIELWSKFSL